jgi:hypothetical protein
MLSLDSIRLTPAGLQFRAGGLDLGGRGIDRFGAALCHAFQIISSDAGVNSPMRMRTPPGIPWKDAELRRATHETTHRQRKKQHAGIDRMLPIAKIPDMKTISQALHEAVEKSAETPHAIAKASGVPVPSLHRFLTGERGLTLESADKLAAYLGFELTPRKARKAKAKRPTPKKRAKR